MAIPRRYLPSGIDSRQTFISWLGVTPYLSLDAIGATLGSLPACSLAVSYTTPQDTWPDAVRAVSERFRAIAVIDDVGFEDVEPRYDLPALSVGNERVALARADLDR